MTGKQELQELVNQLPDDISIQEVSSVLQSFVRAHYVSQSPSGRVRLPGACAGEFVVPDDFDDPLPDDLQAAFEGRGKEE